MGSSWTVTFPVLFSVSIPFLADFRSSMWPGTPRTAWYPTTTSQEWIRWCQTLAPGRSMSRPSKLGKVSKRKLRPTPLFSIARISERHGFCWVTGLLKVLGGHRCHPDRVTVQRSQSRGHNEMLLRTLWVEGNKLSGDGAGSRGMAGCWGSS